VMRYKPRRHDLIVLLEALGILFGLAMLATRGHADDAHVDIAVLKNRTDQIDRHLQSTDDSVARLWVQQNQLAADVSEMHGEERVAWGVITLLCGGTLVVQVRGKKGP